MGTVFIEGTENVVISNCTFTRVDSTAIFISGYNRNATVDGNEFVWLGENAIASWGYTNGVDGTDGNQPIGNIITNNLCHEWGVYEKQTSCYFQAISALSYVAGNIFFNGTQPHLSHHSCH
jgi:hypothetical protein